MVESKTRLTEEQLQNKKKELEEEQEKFEYEAKQVLKEEEEEDWEITRSQNILARMRQVCTSEDVKMQQLIYEKQDRLSAFRRKKIEFDEEFHKEIRSQRQKLEEKMDEVQHQISDIRYKNEEENNYDKGER